MIVGFLKSFLSGDKSVEEQALLAANSRGKRDVLTVDTTGLEEDAEEESCGTKKSGCSGCGCG